MGKGREIDWSPVWEKIVRLYQDPDISLSKLMVMLREEDGFIASKRAYWNKFKKERLSGRDSSQSDAPDQEIPDGPMPVLEVEVPMDTNEAHRSPRHYFAYQAQSAPAVVLDDPSAHLDFERQASHLFQVIETTQNEQEVWRLLSFASFSYGQDSVLHQSVRHNGRHINSVLGYMKATAVSIDLRDHEGHTALELAVMVDHATLLETLVNAGAMMDTYNAQRDSPLHFAVHSSAFACMGILLRTNVNVCSPNTMGDSPLGLLVDLLDLLKYPLNLTGRQAWLDAVGRVDSLLDHATDHQLRQHEEPFARLISVVYSNLFVLDFRNRDAPSQCRRLLKRFLDRGCTPLVRAYGRLRACSAGCRSLAELAAFHDSDGGLWDLVIESTTAHPRYKYGEELMGVLLRPCCVRGVKHQVSDRVENLLDAGYRILTSEKQAAALSEILNNSDRETSKEMLEVLLRRSAIDSIPDLRGSLSPLFDLLRSLKTYHQSVTDDDYKLAEILLLQDEGFARDRNEDLADVPGCLFVYHPGFHYLRYLQLAYVRHVRHTLNVDRSRKADPYMVADAFYCILDVLTKRMLSNQLPEPRNGTHRSRSMAALRIRQSFKLPDIAVDSEVLVQWLLAPVVSGSHEALDIAAETQQIVALVTEYELDEEEMFGEDSGEDESHELNEQEEITDTHSGDDFGHPIQLDTS
ncbi:hypothetical protein LTR15_004271 [Elasticomyces elasticus]|nr:hypothetical protein LTR15_004271 [Elasticomyces elasticus]